MFKEPHPNETNKWSHKYNQCVVCESNKYPHKVNGFCSRCYNLATKKETHETTILQNKFNVYLAPNRVSSNKKESIAEESKPIELHRSSLEPKPWSRKYDRCIKCGDNQTRHIARGLCLKCYQRETEQRHIGSHNYRPIKERLTYEYLFEEYRNKKRSLGEIAKDCNCTRQNIFKALKKCGVPLRDKTEARTLAHQKDKIVFKRKDDQGNITEVVANKITVNKEFFSSWSSEMAYVLGVIYTDGNLFIASQNDKRYRNSYAVKRLSIAQKESELLDKILKLMKCNSKLIFSKERVYANTISGAVYRFNLNDEKIYDDLTRIGLTPNKSRTVEFPHIPEKYIRHFIRGCWDGDGSVSIRWLDYVKTKPKITASFVSGSRPFIESMATELHKAGLPKRNIDRDRESYQIQFSDNQCKILYEYLYSGVPPEQYLERKYQVFKDYFGNL